MKQLLVAPIMGGLLVIALPVFGLALPIIALFFWVVDGLEKWSKA